MRLTIGVALTFVQMTSMGQGLVGKYQDYFGHSLELRKDSTFRFDWRFDLIHNWATGQWTVSGPIVDLKFSNIYDTLSRPHKADSLVLSIDEKSRRITAAEFAQTALISSGQYQERFDDKFYQKGKRLYLLDRNGAPNKSKRRGIWPQKKWPWGYKKWPTFYKRED